MMQGWNMDGATMTPIAIAFAALHIGSFIGSCTRNRCKSDTHTQNAVHRFFRRVEIERIRSTILLRFTAENRWVTTATPVNMEGVNANKSVLRSRSVACCLRGCRAGVVAVDEPGIHGRRSAAAVHARRLPPLLLGNSGPRTRHRVHAQAASQSEPGMPRRVRQARAIGIGGEVALATARRRRAARSSAWRRRSAHPQFR